MLKSSLKNISRFDQEFSFSLLFFASCFFLPFFFPTETYLQKITSWLFFLTILPGAYIKFILKKSLASFGLNLNDFSKNAWLSIGLSLVVFGFLAFLSRHETLFGKHELSRLVVSDFRFFLAYELLYLNGLFFAFGLFFYGYLSSLLRKKIFFGSVFFQLGSYLLLLIFFGSFNWKALPLFSLFATGTILAHQTRSFFYSYFMNIFAIILFDAYYIHFFLK